MTQTLGELFGYTAADLAANQRGEISQAQRERLARRGRWGRLFLVGFFLLWLVLTVLAISAENLALAGFYLIFLVIVLALALYDRRERAHIRAEVVAQVSGPASLSQSYRTNTGSSNRTTYHYALSVDEVHFPISNEAYMTLQKDQHYTVYYVDKTTIILSIDPTPPTAASTQPAPPAAMTQPNKPTQPKSPPPMRPDADDLADLIAQYVGQKPIPALFGGSSSAAHDYDQKNEWYANARLQIDRAGEAALPHLLPHWENKGVQDRLLKIGAPAVPGLMATLSDQPIYKAGPLAKLLARMRGAEAFAAVAGYLDVQAYNDAQRCAAAVALQHIDDPRQAETLYAILDDPEPQIAAEGVRGLAKLDIDRDRAASYMTSEVGILRATAGAALSEMGDPRGFPYVYGMATSDIDATRGAAVERLMDIIHDDTAREHLARLLNDPDAMTRAKAERAVQRLRDHDDQKIARWAKKQKV